MKRATRTKRSSTFSTNILSPFREISPLKRVLPRLFQPTESSIRIKYNFSLAEKKASKLVSHARWKDSIFEIYIYIYGFYKRWLIHWPREFHWFRVHGNGSRHWVRIGSSRALLSAPLLSTLPASRFPSKSLFFPFFVSIRSALCSSPLVSPAYLLPPTSFLPSPITLSPLFLSPSVTVSRMFTTKPDVPDAVWHWRIAVFLIRAIRFPLRGKEGGRGEKRKKEIGPPRDL